MKVLGIISLIAASVVCLRTSREHLDSEPAKLGADGKVQDVYSFCCKIHKGESCGLHYKSCCQVGQCKRFGFIEYCPDKYEHC